jgi:hypothetical protein
LNKDVCSVTDGKLNVKQKQKLFGRSEERRETFPPSIYSSDGPTAAGSKIWGRAQKERGRNRAPALNSRYTELDIFRMTSSPSPAPSPNALFALLRCALWRQPTGGALRGFRISMTGVNVR